MPTKLDTFKSPRFVGKPLLADVDFFEELQKIDQFAAKGNLQIFITSSARLHGAPLGDVIFPPASRSNHLVGHAIDINILQGEQLFNGDALDNSQANRLPGAIQEFVQSIRNDSVLRWGADFGDPVHIDDGFNLRNPVAWEQKYSIIQSDLAGLTQPSTAAGGVRLLFLTRPFMQGDDVLEVQRVLVSQGFQIKPDSEFGPLTDVAVTAFQQKNGLTADGIVGATTRKALGLIR
jgi:hypothetical protein